MAFDFLKKLSIFEEETKEIKVEQPLSDQIENVGGNTNVKITAPVYTNQPQQTQTFQQPQANVFAPAPIITPELQQKWQSYFEKFFSSLDHPGPSYHEFADACDAMAA